MDEKLEEVIKYYQIIMNKKLLSIVDVPKSPSSLGTKGDIAFDENYFYLRHDTSWKRIKWDTTWINIASKSKNSNLNF